MALRRKRGGVPRSDAPWAAAALLVAVCFARPAWAADPVPILLLFTEGGVAYSE